MKRQRKFRQYTRDDILRALEAVDNGEMSKHQAARSFNIPRSTLLAYHENRNRNRRLGPTLTFTEAEESSMIEWARDLHQNGLSLRRSDLLEAAQWILETCPRKGRIKDNTPTNSWCRAFERRHPQVTSYLQVESTASEKPDTIPLLQCFEEIFQHLDSTETFCNPTRVYRYYEIGFGLGSNILEYFKGTGGCSLRPDLVTTALITSAAGQLAFPMIVYPYNETIPLDLAATVPLFYGCGNSANGMMTKETFYNFITKIFYKFLVFNNIQFPVVLFVDGTRPNISLELWQACKKLQIVMVAFNPYESLNGKKHSALKTRLTRQVKDKLGEALLRWKEISPNHRISDMYFSELLEPVVQTGVTDEVIMKDWRKFQFYQWIIQRRNLVEDIEFVNAIAVEPSDSETFDDININKE